MCTGLSGGVAWAVPLSNGRTGLCFEGGKTALSLEFVEFLFVPGTLLFYIFYFEEPGELVG